VSYIEELGRELTRAGIGVRLRRRILAEISDHLACDPKAELGSAEDLACQFADELGTVRARRAAFAGFGALAVAGTLVVAVFAATAHAGIALPKVHAPSQLIFDLGMTITALGGQVAFAAGVLAALRALRRRGAPVLARAEALVMRRRTAVALVAGLACMAGLAVLAVEANHAASWWRALGLSAAGAGACAIVAALVPLGRSFDVLPLADGATGDVFDDFGWLTPPPLRGRPWTPALLLAGGIAVVLAVAGVIQSDPYDGALRGLLDGVACLAGFALLGRYLGLRPALD
jgi:hypothetical protein